MKSGLAKRLLSLVLTAALFMGNVMPVMAEGNATVSGNDIVNTTEVVAQETQPEVPVESKSVQDIVTAGVAQDIVVNDLSQEPVVEEPVVEEPVVEDTVSENEVPEEVVEEIPEEIVESDDASVSENEIQEDESVSMNEIPEEEVPLAGTLPVTLEPVTVNGITITVSGPASAFAEGTTVSAVEVEPAEVVIEAAEAEEQAKVMRFKAFDINLVCNGEIVQPLNDKEITVNFEGDLLIPTSEKEDVVVYHVDENDDITKMEAEVATVETEEAAEVETVEMTTTHFSTYVVMVTGEENKVKVTIEHYLGETDDEANTLFVPEKKENVCDGDIIRDFIKGQNYYIVSKILMNDEPVEEEDIIARINSGENVSLTLDVDDNASAVDIKVFYTPTTSGDEPYINGVSVFDYKDGGNSLGSINYEDNYREGSQSNNRMATKGAAGIYRLQVNPTTGEKDNSRNKVNANDYCGDPGRTSTPIVKGLLKGVKDGGYGDVEFKYDDPGFFTRDEKEGKIILDGYQFKFNRTGVMYELDSLLLNGEEVTEEYSLTNFFPLPKDEEIEVIKHPGFLGRPGYTEERVTYVKNEYFGMRYDFEFTIRDYVGAMDYTFTGDDDLWVCMDGKVILDLGGIHQGYPTVYGNYTYAPNYVDIWDLLLEEDTMANRIKYVENHKDEKHKITVIFMERGGEKSNCTMKFTMPNITASEPHVTAKPRANLNILKVEEGTQNPIANVKFGLYKNYINQECSGLLRESNGTDEFGKVTFDLLSEGIYYLKETNYDNARYQRNDTVYKVEVTVDIENMVANLLVTDLSTNEVVTPIDGNYVITNTPFESIELQFSKVDKFTNDTISNAEFTLCEKNADGVVISENSITADTNGMYKYSVSKAGTYYLKETKTPDGYKTPDEEWIIKVEAVDNGTRLTYSISGGPEGLLDATNKIIKNEPYASIVFTKVDAKTDVAIDGAVFKLYNYSNNKAGEEPQTATSTTEGIVKFDGLTVGQKYLLEETTPAEGYIKPTNPWIVEVVYDSVSRKLVQYIYETEINNTGEITIKTDSVKELTQVENTLANGDITIVKTVDKVDSVHGKAAFMFKISFLDEDNKVESVLYRTISFTEAGTKSVTIEDLPLGKYTVEEVEPTLRYTMDKVNLIGEQELTVDGLRFEFSNKKVFNNYFSHSDVKVNKVTFTREDGQVKAELQQSESSDNVVVVNN